MDDALVVHGPPEVRTALVYDSPHSGRDFPADFDALATPEALREGEDCWVDALYLPATEQGARLLATRCARTYIDVNRHAADIDLDLMDDRGWPHAHQPSGKARIGKALIWRLLNDGSPIYARKLDADEVLRRVARYHQPYHQTLAALIDDAHQGFGYCVHINCHSMNSVSDVKSEGPTGTPRADIVLGDRDGSTCSPRLTQMLHAFFVERGYDVRINDPFKGVELVRAFADPTVGRHSLQLEINKRVYMDETSGERHGGYARVQADLMAMTAALLAPELGDKLRG